MRILSPDQPKLNIDCKKKNLQHHTKTLKISGREVESDD